MNIAVVAPPYLPCPPRGYGGVERVVAALVNGLYRAGHSVTLFGHPESQVAGSLVTPAVEQTEVFDFQKDALHASAILEMLNEYEIVHNHSVALLLFRNWLHRPLLTTVHGTTHYDAVRPIYRAHSDANYVSISERQRVSGLLSMNWLATVYNGVDTHFFRPSGDRQFTSSYLLHIGTLCERKGTAEAVQVALRSGRRLVMAGRIDPINQRYFDERVRPFIDGEQVEFVGEVDGPDKLHLYQNAQAVLLPINWEEPFGLVIAEAGACGVPVLVSDRGSARELVVDGVNGYICHGIGDMMMALDKCADLTPAECRSVITDRFSIEAMVAAYQSVYLGLANA
jgi:glycosyltransferase involved in cell wall biosynthesis